MNPKTPYQKMRENREKAKMFAHTELLCNRSRMTEEKEKVLNAIKRQGDAFDAFNGITANLARPMFPIHHSGVEASEGFSAAYFGDAG